MSSSLNIYFSNRLEILYHQLKESLFDPILPPLMKRIIIVSGPAMKTWIMLKMAQDPELNIAMGVEFIYLSQAFESLLKYSNHENLEHLPTTIELALAIENELRNVIHHYNYLENDKQSDWLPIIQYLKIDLRALSPQYRMTPKMERRLISLSQQLARQFQDYGRFAPEMIAQWKIQSTEWQSRLWTLLFNEKMHWTYPCKALEYKEIKNSSFTVHFFSISFITSNEFSFLHQMSSQVSIHYYLLSPCAIFWSDIRSDRENIRLQAYWQKKLGSDSSQVFQLEEFLRDRNPLLANYGRLGREMACQIEESQALTHSLYVLPENVRVLDNDLFHHEDLCLTETGEPLTLLHALQADLLMMRNPQNAPPIELKDSLLSMQLHSAPSKRREIQTLYHLLLGFISKDPMLTPGEIIVMAPQISDYAPYVRSTFGMAESQLDFQVLDLGMHMQSEIVQGFLQLIELAESRWDTNHLLQLLKHRAFQRRHQFNPSDASTIQKWIEETNIRWGEDGFHRNEILRRSHCEQDMVDATRVGTWDYGLSRLLNGLTTMIGEGIETHLEAPPCPSVDFSQSEILGKWIEILHSLRDDLSPLQDRTRMTVKNWVNFLICLLDNYFQPDYQNSQSMEEYEDFLAQLDILRNSARSFKENLYSFDSIKAHLLSLLENRGMTYREDRLHGVRFCSLVPLRSIPAKVIVLLGMEEGTFPRLVPPSSFNLMAGRNDVNYSPSTVDDDRYLFLEALHSAQDYFICSYVDYNYQENKELKPSLVVEELFSYLDKYYTIQGKRILEKCVFKHPYDSFDECYFIKKFGFNNFSQHDFHAAQSHYRMEKSLSHSFLSRFTDHEVQKSTILENKAQINLRSLSAAMRNPIKFYLSKGLEIFLENEENRKIKTEEEWVLSGLDKYQIKNSSLDQSMDSILFRAEKEGKLPFGLFKDVALKNIKEEIEEIYKGLAKHSIDQKQIFQIHFCTSCAQPVQTEKNQWLFPAVKLSLEDNRELFIVGKLTHATSKGLIVLSKGTLGDTWKAWPEFLLYCYAAKICPEKWEPRLIFTQTSQSKEAFFDDPVFLIEQLTHYYSACLHTFSPLLPEWVPFILDDDAKGLHEKMEKGFDESFGVYPNRELQWVLNRHQLPSAEEIVKNWKPQAEKLLGDMIKCWY